VFPEGLKKIEMVLQEGILNSGCSESQKAWMIAQQRPLRQLVFGQCSHFLRKVVTLDRADVSEIAHASFSTEWRVTESSCWKPERTQQVKCDSTEELRPHELLNANTTMGHSWFRSKHGLSRGDGWISVKDTSTSLHTNVTMEYCVCLYENK
jgi:hypothetical protein